MDYKMIEIESFVGINLQMELLKQESDTLLVLLPGAEYNIWGPSFYYSYSMGSELGYDVLPLVYGFEKVQKKFKFDMLESVVKESKEAIDAAINSGTYSRLVFISRSLGTLVMSELLKDYKVYNTILIYHSPIRQVLECIANNAGFVAIGSNDPILKHIDLNDLKKMEHIDLYLVDGGDHSLDVETFGESIDHMKSIVTKTRDYILSQL